MFISKKKYDQIFADLAWYDLRITILEKLLNAINDSFLEVLDHNQSVIDTNKIVLDKLEEILKANDLE